MRQLCKRSLNIIPNKIIALKQLTKSENNILGFAAR